ncbi:MAG: hypothetical protein EON96_04355 [Caulobacteraceae bacterium]|nr:MAG: hypothetical protein EON96_04355 [Caulobacteraceae bacterium]
MIKAKDPFSGIDPAWGVTPRPELCLELVGAFDLSQGLERALVNHAGGAPARVIGVPVPQANALRFSGGACLETEIFDTEEVCIVSVSRMVAEPVNGAIVAGTYLNNTSPGTSVYYTSGKSLRVSADTAGGLLSSSRALTTSYSEWWINLFSAIYEPAPADRTVINQRGYGAAPGVLAPNLANGPGVRRPAARKFRIGDDYSATFRDAVDIAAVFFVKGLGEYGEPYTLKDAFAADVAAWCVRRSITLG